MLLLFFSPETAFGLCWTPLMNLQGTKLWWLSPKRTWSFSFRTRGSYQLHSINSPECLWSHWTILRPSSFCLSHRKYQAQSLHFRSDIAVFPDCKLVSVCTAFQASVLPPWLIFIVLGHLLCWQHCSQSAFVVNYLGSSCILVRSPFRAPLSCCWKWNSPLRHLQRFKYFR